MRAVMGGAAHAWADGETFNAAFGAAFAAYVPTDDITWEQVVVRSAFKWEP